MATAGMGCQTARWPASRLVIAALCAVLLGLLGCVSHTGVGLFAVNYLATFFVEQARSGNNHSFASKGAELDSLIYNARLDVVDHRSFDHGTYLFE